MGRGLDDPEIPAERLKQKHFPGHTAVYEAGLIPGIHSSHLWEYDCSEVLWFLGRLRKELGTDAFRASEDKAYRWVMDNSVKAFFLARPRAPQPLHGAALSPHWPLRQLLCSLPTRSRACRTARPRTRRRTNAVQRELPPELVTVHAQRPNPEPGQRQHPRVTPRSIATCQPLEPYDLLWIEEPVAPTSSMDEMASVAAATTVPVATGENLQGLEDFSRLIDKRAASILILPPPNVGGLTEARKIATLAKIRGMQIAPHFFAMDLYAGGNGQPLHGRTQCVDS